MTVLKHYTDSLHYEMLLTTKYFKILGTQVFEQECIDLSPEEFATLDVISCNPDMHHKELSV